jgi:hypothetical protein
VGQEARTSVHLQHRYAHSEDHDGRDELENAYYEMRTRNFDRLTVRPVQSCSDLDQRFEAFVNQTAIKLPSPIVIMPVQGIVDVNARSTDCNRNQES